MKDDINKKILRALELADSIMDYCGGDAWERECTKNDRNEFNTLYEELLLELKPSDQKENEKDRERKACIDLWENSKEHSVEQAVHNIAYALNMEVDDVVDILIAYNNVKNKC